MKKFTVEVKREKIKGTTLTKRVEYVFSYGEEGLCTPKGIFTTSDLIEHLNRAIKAENSFLELVPVQNGGCGLRKTLLRTVAGVEPLLSLPVYPIKEINLSIKDENYEFDKKLEILEGYLNLLSASLDAISVMVGRGK